MLDGSQGESNVVAAAKTEEKEQGLQSSAAHTEVPERSGPLLARGAAGAEVAAGVDPCLLPLRGLRGADTKPSSLCVRQHTKRGEGRWRHAPPRGRATEAVSDATGSCGRCWDASAHQERADPVLLQLRRLLLLLPVSSVPGGGIIGGGGGGDGQRLEVRQHDLATSGAALPLGDRVAVLNDAVPREHVLAGPCAREAAAAGGGACSGESNVASVKPPRRCGQQSGGASAIFRTHGPHARFPTLQEGLLHEIVAAVVPQLREESSSSYADRRGLSGGMTPATS